MDDLISRKAAIRKMCGERCGCDPDDCGYDEIGCEFVQFLNKQPTVEAVPLEPLCQWLAGYVAPPNYALQEVIIGYEIQPNLPILSVNYCVEAWKHHFMELLKSGLMQVCNALDPDGPDTQQ